MEQTRQEVQNNLAKADQLIQEGIAAAEKELKDMAQKDPQQLLNQGGKGVATVAFDTMHPGVGSSSNPMDREIRDKVIEGTGKELTRQAGEVVNQGQQVLNETEKAFTDIKDKFVDASNTALGWIGL